MTELDDFDFVDEKLDKGIRVKKKIHMIYGTSISEFGDFADETPGLTNLDDGVYVTQPMDDGSLGYEPVYQFLQEGYINGTFKSVKVKDGKYVK